MPVRDDDALEKTLTATPVTERPAEKHAHLVVLTGPQFGELFELEPGREALIGRSAAAVVHLLDEGVSRRHATITVSHDDARLVDLESANGTFLDGERVVDARLRDGARLQLGAHTSLKFVHSDHPDASFEHKLARGALTEPLTGLYNRRHFMERLTAELAAAQRHGRPLALLLADVDGFRRLNEAHGHAVGDEALRAVAGVLQRTVRREDILARFGGEEFAVLSRETDLTGSKALAERLRKAVARIRVAAQGTELTLTVSVGIAVAAGLSEFERGRTEEQMLTVADRALDRAKRNGRNTVVAAPLLGA